MQAVNYPTTPASPFIEAMTPDEETLPKPSKRPRPLGRIMLIGGAGLAILVAGYALGGLTSGRPSPPSPVPFGLGGFAEMYLSTLLTDAGVGADDVLAPYLGYSPDLEGLKPGTWYVAHTAVLSADPIGPEAWRVLVAATQLGRREGGYGPAGTFFYEVDIEQTPAGLRATGLPALVAAPTSIAPIPTTASDVDENLTDAVTEFLTARFTETNGTPFNAAPFASVMVRSIRAEDAGGDFLEVGVEFLGVDPAGRATLLGYRLLVSKIDGSIVEDAAVIRESS